MYSKLTLEVSSLPQFFIFSLVIRISSQAGIVRPLIANENSCRPVISNTKSKKLVASFAPMCDLKFAACLDSNSGNYKLQIMSKHPS
jgi:hypothetical protein